MDNYPMALESYSKCLEIKERVKGKDSFDTAITLSNIGIVYKNMGNYPMALETCSKAL
jgi:tetratricopeptide (TPR) repeat protein